MTELDGAKQTVEDLALEIGQLIQERDAAREAAREYFGELGYMGEYLFFKHYRNEKKEHPWLEGAAPFLDERDVWKR